MMKGFSVWVTGAGKPRYTAEICPGGGVFNQREAEKLAARMTLLISMGRMDCALRLRDARKLAAYHRLIKETDYERARQTA